MNSKTLKPKIAPPKITVIAYEDIFNAMGTSVRVQRLLSSLSKAGQITVISSSNNKPNELVDIKRIKTINLGAWLLSYKTLPFILKLLPIILWNLLLIFHLLKMRSDVVFCAHEWLGYPAVYGTSLIKKYKIIFEVHSIISQDMEKRGHAATLLNVERKLEIFFCEHSDYVIALSQNTYDFYRKYTDRIDLTHVFVDTNIFAPSTFTKRAVNANKVIGLIGPFAAGDKRGTYCLEYLEQNIDNLDPRIKVIVIGRCDEPIEHTRITCTGFLDSLADYADRLRELDAVIVPEGISTTGPLNKILEPMSCELPVFATPEAVVGLYWINPGENIFVFPIDELTNKINEYIFDDFLMKSTGGKARLLVEQHYSRQANEEKLFYILNNIGLATVNNL